MQFITIKLIVRISNPLINEQKAAALADARVRQHGFCEWISGLDAPWSIQPHRWKDFVYRMRMLTLRQNKTVSMERRGLLSLNPFLRLEPIVFVMRIKLAGKGSVLTKLTVYGYISLALKILTVPETTSNCQRKELDGLRNCRKNS